MTDLQKLTNEILDFRKKRGWTKGKQIAPKNTAIALLMEAAELIELFAWTKNNKLPKNKRKEFEEEIIDILYWILIIAHDNKIDIEKVFTRKMKKNKIKYPLSF